jgi:hypothetical protein
MGMKMKMRVLGERLELLHSTFVPSPYSQRPFLSFVIMRIHIHMAS